MATLTPKENFLKCLNGEQPEWVPPYTMMGPFPGWEWDVPSAMYGPPQLMAHAFGGGGKDIWGVNYVTTESANMASLPDHNFILPLDNLKNWRDVIKAPDYSDVDWEQVVKKHFEDVPIDRTQTAVNYNLHFGYFQLLCSFMGFTDGMLAMYEEPDLVKELLYYVSDFYMDIADKTIDLYKPDIIGLCDDTASWSAPFISVDMYEEFILPHHDRLAKYGRERGLPITMHNCGKSEDYFDLLTGIGVCGWDPAQTSNDLKAVKAKYGNKLVIMGGWDGRAELEGPMKSPENPDGVTEEMLRQSVRDAVDALAPGGGYCWIGMFLAAKGDTENEKKNLIISDEAAKYCTTWYQTH